MKLAVKWFTEGRYPSFNVSISSAEGREPFIEVKGCDIKTGPTGEFVSWPSKKMDSGKFWNHVYASRPFADAVLAEANKSRPKPQERQQERQAAPAGGSGFDDMPDDMPF